MKGFVIAATLLAGVLPAASADMPEKAKQYAPPPVVSCAWCGPEIAVLGGWGWGETRPDITTPFASPKQDGWLVGGSALYRWQPGKGQFVFGLGLDYTFADIKEDQVVGKTTLHTKFEHLASARAQAGFAIGDSVLIYGDAGIAFAKAKAGVDFGTTTVATANENLWGYVVGGGIDFKLAPNIVVGADYSYYGFGKQSYDFVLTGLPIVLGVNADTSVQVIRGKLGVRF